MAISNSASPAIIWGLGGPEEDHQLHHCCWTGRVSEREEEEEFRLQRKTILFGQEHIAGKHDNTRIDYPPLLSSVINLTRVVYSLREKA